MAALPKCRRRVRAGVSKIGGCCIADRSGKTLLVALLLVQLLPLEAEAWTVLAMGGLVGPGAANLPQELSPRQPSLQVLQLAGLGEPFALRGEHEWVTSQRKTALLRTWSVHLCLLCRREKPSVCLFLRVHACVGVYVCMFMCVHVCAREEPGPLTVIRVVMLAVRTG